MKYKRKFDQEKFERLIKDWEWNWVENSDTYTKDAKGDAVKLALAIYGKYFSQIVKAYSIELK